MRLMSPAAPYLPFAERGACHISSLGATSKNYRILE